MLHRFRPFGGPEEVLEVLNIYLGRMAEVITEYNGTIVDFIGDAILVVFGAPLQRDDDASRAVACAIGMQRASVVGAMYSSGSSRTRWIMYAAISPTTPTLVTTNHLIS